MRHANSDAGESYTYSHIHSDANSYGNVYANSHSNSNAYTDSYPNSHGHSNCYSYSYSDCDCECVPEAFPDAQAATYASSPPIASAFSWLDSETRERTLASFCFWREGFSNLPYRHGASDRRCW
jgi:hypothetical protein